MTARDDAEAWLATVGVSTLDTIRSSPSETVVPTLRRGEPSALALLEQLRGRSPIESAQLVHGDVLGEGGMGIVRAAEQVALGRTVAVKTLKHRDPDAALALLREAWVTGQVEHPNVVPIHYVELAADGTPLVVMKRITGVEWSKLVDRADEVERRFGATDLLAWNLGILMQVLNAVRFAHHQGVIHRDLKPSNVMIGDFGEVYLLDWGIAVSLRDDPSGRLPTVATATELAGTPAYLAPEMLGRVGSPPLSERTDVYLAGSVLYEIITGTPPHRGHDLIAVIANVIASTPALDADVPAELARICRCAMADDPAARFPSAEAMRLALQAYLEHRGSVELAARAQARLVELDALLARPDAERDDVYRVFGACRFGFHEALARWPNNHDAKASLDRATIAVAEYELVAGEPAAAQTLLADVHAPELAARVAAAKAETAAQLAEAAKLRADLDPNTGRRTRVTVALMFGAMWTAVPLAARLINATENGLAVAALGALMMIALGLAYAWGRESLGSTLFNRRLLRAALFLFAMHVVLGLGAWQVGLERAQLAAALVFVWAFASGLFAITIEPRIAASCIGFLAAFVAVLLWPAEHAYAMAAGNLVVTLNLGLAWRPATFHPTEEEAIRFKVRNRHRARPRPRGNPPAPAR
jgi:serine/threonine-protein kinase